LFCYFRMRKIAACGSALESPIDNWLPPSVAESDAADRIDSPCIQLSDDDDDDRLSPPNPNPTTAIATTTVYSELEKQAIVDYCYSDECRRRLQDILWEKTQCDRYDQYTPSLRRSKADRNHENVHVDLINYGPLTYDHMVLESMMLYQAQWLTSGKLESTRYDFVASTDQFYAAGRHAHIGFVQHVTAPEV
jgi:hypothetical protein